MKKPPRTKLNPKNLSRRGIPRLFFNATIDQYNIDPEIKNIFSRYLDNLDQMYEDNVGLMLYGTNGSGKTYLASLVVKEAYRLRYSSFRVTLQEFINLQFQKNDLDVFERLQDIIFADFLVIDEVGKEIAPKSNFNVIVLEELLRQRETSGKPTILCTNLPLEGEGGLYQQYGKSIKSLIEGCFVKIKFTGKDFRYDVVNERKAIKILFEGREY